MNPLAVEFEITDPARFEPLRVVFEELRDAKAKEAFTDDYSHWLDYFDADARAYFRWSTPEEDALWVQRWIATPVHARGNDPSLHRGWDYESLIEAFRNGEYELGECERVNQTTGRLTFYEHAYPFGGTECMRVLIECFGHRVTRDWDDSTPPPEKK